MKIIETYKCKNKFIDTPKGKIKVLEVHKTIKYNIFRIELENGLFLEASELHVLIDANDSEIYIKDCLGKNIKTIQGVSRVIKKEFIKYDNCYDLTLEDYPLYYSNGILSHNSSKSTTTAVYLSHLFLFREDLTMGIVAYKGEMAREFLDKTKKILGSLPIWMQNGVITWNKGSIEGENNSRILTDVPSENSFRGYSCNILVVDETAFLIPESWQAFSNSVVPSQAGLSFKKLVLLSTPNGKNHFYDIWTQAGDTKNTSQNGFIRYFVNWRDVPRRRSDGSKYDPEDFKRETLKKYGPVLWNSAYECNFIGSAETLIPGEILNNFKIQDPIEIDKFGNSLIKIYENPIQGHKYVMGVDTAKDGLDYSGIQIFDMTDLNFKQVLSAKLKIDYVMLPEIINEYGLKFNSALVIVENNEGSGQVVADTLKKDFEYENLYYDYKPHSKERQKYPGFRTTKVSREIMLQTVKMLAENNKLTLVDSDTIKEFETFTANEKGKYQAAFGYHDDLVMSCCLCFGIFNNIKNFEDFRVIIDSIKSGNSVGTDYLTFGAFGDGLGTSDDADLSGMFYN